MKVDSRLNIRKAPGTGNKAVGSLTNGTVVEILETQKVGNVTWGRIEKGWISLEYVQLDQVEETPEVKPEEKPEETPEETPEEKPEETPEEKPEETPDAEKTVTGTISCGTAKLRIRVAPDGDLTGNYLVTGDKVTVLEQKTVDGVLWGRIEKGWIKMQYVILDKTESESTTTGKAGTVTGNDLRIRSGPGTNYSVLGLLHTGDQVTILETKTVGNMTWGRIRNGWICMDYVKF